MNNASKHYNKKYFDWQKKLTQFGGKAHMFQFKRYVKKIIL